MPEARWDDIADDLRRRILDDQEWQPGEKIPRMEDLAAHYRAARGSVAQAVRELEAEGLLRSQKRWGTVVQQRPPRRRIARDNKVHKRRTRGYSFGATRPDEPRWIQHMTPAYSEEPITGRAAELLGLEAGTTAFRRRRLTSPAGEPPFNLAEAWIPLDIAQAAPHVRVEGVPGEWWEDIEDAGHGPLTWTEITRARRPTKDEAALLQIAPRMWVIEIVRLATSASTDRPVAVDMTAVPADRWEGVATLHRDDTAIYEVLSLPGGPHSYKEA